MDGRLLHAAVSGDATEIMQLAMHDPALLLGTTPHGNTCLHIASIHGHEGFCNHVLTLQNTLDLLPAVNGDGETPLLAALTNGHASLASVLLRRCRQRQLSQAVLKQDNRGCNALHHAVRSGYRELALELLEAEPELSKSVNNFKESPMFVAVMKNYDHVFKKLLEIPDSAHEGACENNALHAAVRNGNSAIAKLIMEKRPALVTEKNSDSKTPMQMAVNLGQIEMVRVFLEHDRSLGYIYSSEDGKKRPLLFHAAKQGHVGVARELLKHCPDAPSCQEDGYTCLHHAVRYQRTEFVEFVLGSPLLHKLINMRDEDDETPLHLAVRKCNPKMVAALLRCQDIDVTMLNKSGESAIFRLTGGATDHAKTLNWNEVSMLMLKADPRDAASISNIYRDVKSKVTNSTRKDIKSLTQTYTGNTSLVAILIATITFAAAFTLPGGYSSDAESQGLPIMARKFAFQAFLISDTLAMCSSLAIAFICIIAKWEDLEFLLYYRSFTRKLMWFAYVATTTAFATGLYTVLAPRLLWLAVAICVLTCLFPILTKLLGEWPILKLRFRLGQSFKSELLDMV